MTADRPQYTGGCLCTAVRYQIAGALRDITACHCTQCRKTSGHFVVATACKTKNLTVTEACAGAPSGSALTWFASSPDAKRGFCNRCGSSLFWRHNHRDTTSIMAGTLDHAADLKIRAHIYTADAGEYYEIDDRVPKFEGNDRDD